MSETRTVKANLRLTPAEYELLQTAAQCRSLPIGAMLREAAMHTSRAVLAAVNLPDPTMPRAAATARKPRNPA